ncbi:MAG: sigma-70 family RNA polymerase sigma factor [Gemmataceae bacterium]|nr:sigma-70 family RNA polymerase sigma factor [Gemmataceae bacterium]
MGEPTTGELLARAQANDRDALCGLVSRLYPIVRNWAVEFARGSRLADDIQQDVFVVFCEKSPHERARDIPALITWLRRATRNVACAHLRGLRKAGQQLREEDLCLVSSEPEPPTVAESRENLAIVQLLINDLADDDRAILHMKVIEGRSFGEIAASLGVPEATARGRAHRARQRLCALLVATGRRGLAEAVGQLSAADDGQEA